ncbi:MAG TPA: T9SS type A sorting domain-containing protein [Bacteroidia bacterium]|nr:T9SS type A sorting domain-containing protein [Bacteroidia bacterium]
MEEEGGEDVISRVDTDTATADTLHRVDLTFELHQEKVVPASETTKPFSVEKNSQGYLNYFLPQCPNGITGVEGFNKLFYPEVFDSTDILFYGNDGGMKFYIIMKPGADYDVGLNFDGQDSITVIGDTVLNIHSSIATYSYPRPEVFQIDGNGNRVALNWLGEYVDWGNGRVGFYVGSIDGNLPFVIEVGQSPSSMAAGCIDNLCWSTYVGGNIQEDFNDMTLDKYGNPHVTGYTTSTNFPWTANVVTGGSLGGDKAILAKFKQSSDSLLWATYYGGNNANCTSNSNLGNGVTVKFNGDVVMVGSTDCNNFPVQASTSGSGYFQNSNNATGGFCRTSFIVKLDSTGTVRKWATYYGGTGQTVLGDPVFVPRPAFFYEEYLYVVGNSDTTTPVMFKQGAYNDFVTGGALILEFDSRDTIVWGSFICTGIAYSIARGTDILDYNTYVTGSVKSNSLPIVNPGGNAYVDNSHNGYDDIFIIKFNVPDTVTWSTYYGGSLLHDAGYAITVKNDRIAVTGQTSSTNFPTYWTGGNQYIDSVNTGTTVIDACILKFTTGGELLWATLYGGDELEFGHGVAFDDDMNLFVTGVTESYNSFNTQPFTGTYYDNSGASRDAFVLGFSSWNQLQWATFFGGNSDDRGTEIAVYQNSALYLCGSTYSTETSFPLADPLGNSDYYDGIWEGGTYAGDAFISRFVLTGIGIGINEVNTINGNFALYPNPNDGSFTIVLNDIHERKIKLHIYSVLGAEVYSSEIVNDGNGKKKIDVNKLASGLYMIRVEAGNKMYSSKFIKQ